MGITTNPLVTTAVVTQPKIYQWNSPKYVSLQFKAQPFHPKSTSSRHRKGGVTKELKVRYGRISRTVAIKCHSQRDVRAARRPIAQCTKRCRRFLFRPRRHRRAIYARRFLRHMRAAPYPPHLHKTRVFQAPVLYTNAAPDDGFLSFHGPGFHW